MLKRLSCLTSFLLVFAVCFAGERAVAIVPVDVASLKSEGAYGFLTDDTITLSDNEQIRVQCRNDSKHVAVQVIVWIDGNDELGETNDGRAIGDSSTVVFDLDTNGKRTQELDRSYTLNPWPSLPGLHYTIPLGRASSSSIQRDSTGRGAIRYLKMADGNSIRVDSYIIPLSELKVEPGDKIRLAAFVSSTVPKLTIPSSPQTGKRPVLYARDMKFKTFHEWTLANDGAVIDVKLIPEGRKDPVSIVKPKTKPLLKVGAVPPPIQAEGWIGIEGKPPTWKSLQGKVVLVDFWATWCGPCVAGIPHMNELQAKHRDDGFIVLGPTDQSLKGITKFQEERVKMEYLVACGSEMAAEFGARALPHVFIVGRDGKLFWEGHPGAESFMPKLQSALDVPSNHSATRDDLKAGEPKLKKAEGDEAANGQTTEQEIDKSSGVSKPTPGRVHYIKFPQLEKNWKGAVARAGVFLPENFDPKRKFPLLVSFGGGSGTDYPGRAIGVANRQDFICVGLPYRQETEEFSGGWQTDWTYYKTMLDEVEAEIPNIDPTRRACIGYSSGGAAILYQIGNSQAQFQKYFNAFIPCAAGWPMGGLETLKGRPMLAVVGQHDKRLPNFQALKEAAEEAGVDFRLDVVADAKHKIPAEKMPSIRQWLVSKMNMEADPRDATGK